MTPQTVKALSIIFLFAFLGNVIWLCEIVGIVGWHGLTWLRTVLYSPYPGILTAAMAFMVPFLLNRPLKKKNIFIPLLIFSTANLLCFEAGRIICYMLYRMGFFFDVKNFIAEVLIVAGLYLLLGFTYKITSAIFIRKNTKKNILLISFLLPMAIPLSLLTIEINAGFGTGTGWVDAVKMGYPIFWTTMLLGISGILIEGQPDISE
jgi:hypothetical protein